MIINKTYFEARMTAISILSELDCNLSSLTITYDKVRDTWNVNYEHLGDEDWERT